MTTDTGGGSGSELTPINPKNAKQGQDASDESADEEEQEEGWELFEEYRIGQSTPLVKNALPTSSHPAEWSFPTYT